MATISPATGGSIPNLSVQELQSQLANIHDNRAPQMVAASTVFIVVTTIAVALRLTSRRIQGLRLGPDDYWILVSLALAFGMFISIMYAISYGMGKHIIVAGFTKGPKAARSLYVFEILFPASNTASKLSTLYLYIRIFGSTRSRPFYLSIYIVGTLWCLIFVIGTCCTIFQCGTQFVLAWTTDHSRGCLNLNKMVLSLTCVSAVLNFCTLAIPLPFIHRVKLSPKVKVGVFAIFMLGCGDMGICIARAIETSRTNLTNLDFTWRQVSMVMLAFSEPCVGIICTCFILLRPVILKCRSILADAIYTSSASTPRPRFLITLEDTYAQEERTKSEEQSKSENSGRWFTIRIYLRGREALANLNTTLRTGLSGATAVFTTQRGDAEGLEDWELRAGQDRRPSGGKRASFLTHPWRMDTFDNLEKNVNNDMTPTTGSSIDTASKAQALAIDKPLPPVPDEADVSSLSDDGTGTSFRSFG